MHSAETGVLVIAHGSRSQRWVQLVEEAAAAVNSPHPLTVGYLELVEGRSIADGVRQLERKGVQRILAVPLFVSSGSTHLEEIQYALGVIEKSHIETELERINPQVPITWTTAMDDHKLVESILAERIAALSTQPEKEALLLVAHGSEKPGFRQVWEEGLAALTTRLNQRFSFAEADYAMLRLGDVREKAERLSRHRTCLVAPVFLSPGYFTEKVVPAELNGLPCRYRGETYLPHPDVSRWVEEVIGKRR
ncbi:sirohydrochlorin chelatase [Desmospora activa]|uniref:Sirohydrochlorin ferrochelatase n=1 Tax=Desmospora activa DSM 45169 TaxID=1121389 RepID=A0A2T4Z7M3_9BACL|nr:CbiX/SirB N-terminal domain-containing protein [Desmospora activa]PTM57881.1 sirohydrochlorin ferrochelatase [Desmospora activa DSM 45169]